MLFSEMYGVDQYFFDALGTGHFQCNPVHENFLKNAHQKTLEGPVLFSEMYGVDQYFFDALGTGHVQCGRVHENFLKNAHQTTLDLMSVVGCWCVSFADTRHQYQTIQCTDRVVD